MKEVEVKARLKNKNLVIKNLEKRGCFLSEPVRQVDKVFLPLGMDMANYPPATPFLRIRQEKDKIIFTLKKSVTNELDSVEKEVLVNDKEQLEAILNLLDYHLVIKVDKTRQKCVLDQYEICLDDVIGLGSFIEIEKKTAEEGSLVQEELRKVLKELGVSMDEIVIKGYDTLLYEKSP